MLLILAFTACKYDQDGPLVDCDVEGPTLSLVDKQEANCGEADGSITLFATGGDGNYSFSSSQSEDQASSLYIGLPAGNYEFVVRDGNLCTSTIQVSLGNIDGVQITDVATGDSGCSAANGSVMVTAAMGTPPYMYQLDDGTSQSSNIFSSLSADTYTVKVSDSDGCEFVVPVSVLSGVSFASEISPIIAANCAISGCHNGSQFPDFTILSNIQSNAERIKIRTSNMSMPIGRSLTQQQIDQIACWVDDGAPNN